MKKEKNTQNVIVELDFIALNKVIRYEDKNGRLLGNNGVWSNGYSEINDEIILHRFGYLKGTMDALDLLGKILVAIDDCLNYIYFVEYNNKKYRAIGEYEGCGVSINDIQSESGDEILEEDRKAIHNYVYENEKDILIECHKMIKYYKEYYTRLFDRGRTVK